jgi:hypothetical protein
VWQLLTQLIPRVHQHLHVICSLIEKKDVAFEKYWIKVKFTILKITSVISRGISQCGRLIIVAPRVCRLHIINLPFASDLKRNLRKVALKSVRRKLSNFKWTLAGEDHWNYKSLKLDWLASIFLMCLRDERQVICRPFLFISLLSTHCSRNGNYRWVTIFMHVCH